MTTEYFSKANLSLADLKKEYYNLLKNNHPDLGGSTRETQKIINEYNNIIQLIIDNGFEFYQKDREERGKPRYDKDLYPFYDILKKVIELHDYDMVVQIIGFWIYCFKSFKYKEQLKDLGFWYSKKHRAWVYNGSTYKSFLRTKLSLNKIKEIHGVARVQEKEEEKIIKAIV